MGAVVPPPSALMPRHAAGRGHGSGPDPEVEAAAVIHPISAREGAASRAKQSLALGGWCVEPGTGGGCRGSTTGCVGSAHAWRHHHRVDEVDRRVGGVHATADHVGAVDLEVVAGAGDLEGAALRPS